MCDVEGVATRSQVAGFIAELPDLKSALATSAAIKRKADDAVDKLPVLKTREGMQNVLRIYAVRSPNHGLQFVRRYNDMTDMTSSNVHHAHRAITSKQHIFLTCLSQKRCAAVLLTGLK